MEKSIIRMKAKCFKYFKYFLSLSISILSLKELLRLARLFQQLFFVKLNHVDTFVYEKMAVNSVY